nr:hypothetical protein [Nonlabens sp. YIK11]
MIALVDCNSFYASCEQVFRPDLKGRPVIVLSNNDGCVIAANKQAKALADIQCFSPSSRSRKYWMLIMWLIFLRTTRFIATCPGE